MTRLPASSTGALSSGYDRSNVFESPTFRPTSSASNPGRVAVGAQLEGRPLSGLLEPGGLGVAVGRMPGQVDYRDIAGLEGTIRYRHDPARPEPELLERAILGPRVRGHRRRRRVSAS